MRWRFYQRIEHRLDEQGSHLVMRCWTSATHPTATGCSYSCESANWTFFWLPFLRSGVDVPRSDSGRAAAAVAQRQRSRSGTGVV